MRRLPCRRTAMDADSLVGLPGIGLSTAHAIISQATDQPAAVLDGNVRRVLARHAAIEGWSGKSSIQKRLWKEAESRLPANRGADYTQAIMDLGATVCARNKPACESCPVANDCQARVRGLVSELPTPKPATGSGRNRSTSPSCAAVTASCWKSGHLPESGAACGVARPSESRPRAGKRPQTGAVQHRLSHVQMNCAPTWSIIRWRAAVKCNANHEWFEASQVSNLGLPRPVAELLQKLNQGDFE